MSCHRPYEFGISQGRQRLDEDGHGGALVEPGLTEDGGVADEATEVVGPFEARRREPLTELFPFIHGSTVAG